MLNLADSEICLIADSFSLTGGSEHELVAHDIVLRAQDGPLGDYRRYRRL